MIARIWLFLVVVYSEIVFYFKHRGGFIDLATRVAVTGTVLSAKYAPNDGDATFDLLLDTSYFWACTFAQRSTTESGISWAIHCEVMPRERLRDAALAATVASLKPGDRLRVTGDWAYDGVHHGHGFFFDVSYCLVGGGQPSPHGWTELHRVLKIEVLT